MTSKKKTKNKTEVSDLRVQFFPSPLYPCGQAPQMKEPSVLLQTAPGKQG